MSEAMNKRETDYTRILLENQKEFLKAQERVTEVLTGMKESLCVLNDNNVLHMGKEDSRYESINKLAAAVEARSRVMNTIMIILVAALVVLAGAEKALQVLKIL